MKWLFLLKMYLILYDVCVLCLIFESLNCLGWCTCHEQIFIFFTLQLVLPCCQPSWLPVMSCQVSHQPRLEERWNSAEHQIGAEARHHWLPGVRLSGATDGSDRSGGGVQVRRSSRTGELFGEFFGVKDNSLQKGAGYNKMNSYISLSLLL